MENVRDVSEYLNRPIDVNTNLISVYLLLIYWTSWGISVTRKQRYRHTCTCMDYYSLEHAPYKPIAPPSTIIIMQKCLSWYLHFACYHWSGSYNDITYVPEELRQARWAASVSTFLKLYWIPENSHTNRTFILFLQWVDKSDIHISSPTIERRTRTFTTDHR